MDLTGEANWNKGDWSLNSLFYVARSDWHQSPWVPYRNGNNSGKPKCGYVHAQSSHSDVPYDDIEYALENGKLSVSHAGGETNYYFDTFTTRTRKESCWCGSTHTVRHTQRLRVIVNMRSVSGRGTIGITNAYRSGWK